MSRTVIHLINSLGAGGAEHSLSELLPGFAAAAFRPIVVCLYRRDEGVERSTLEANHDVRFAPSATPTKAVPYLRRLLRTERAALLHTTLFEANMIGRAAAFGTGVPVLTSLVSTQYEPARFSDPHTKPWKIRVVQTLDAVTSHLGTTHFHAITHAVKDASVRALRIRPDSITVVERGRDAERLGTYSDERRAAARRSLGLRNDELVLICVGREEYPKGHLFLLESIRLLMAQGRRVKLLMLGRRGNMSPAIETAIRDLGIGGSVVRLGHRQDVPDLLCASDVFVFPSLYEGLGGAAIEAMALSRPIIATAIPAFQEILEHEENALLVPISDPTALAIAIARLLDSPDDRARFGARSRAIFEDRFTQQRSNAEMTRLFERVARLPPTKLSSP